MTTLPFGMAIAATGGYAPDYPAVEAGIARLRQQGFLIHNYYQHEARHQRFAGTDEARLAQLYAAAEDPEVEVVLALRGSYGMSRLLPHIDFERLADSGKLFVGYSDFTAFQMAYMKQTGCISFAGPMFCGDYARETLVGYTMQQFHNCLRGPLHQVLGEVAEEGSDNPVVDVRGQLWGGNLAMLVSLLGTPYFAAQPDGILFLEDISEHPYRIERMVLQLYYAGALAGQQALMLGDFSGYKLSPYDNGYDFEAMLAYLRSVLPLPVLTGLPFGHIERRATLPYGAMAHLRSTARTLELTLSEYPTLRG
ncbi:muramoyltetrapeptide carboxypeptidase [Pseudoduganella danionis]|uniref:Muramoyltetrapeptide carboxypeptidase n=1 Tax=Pseudoduganella danionis TaxID=1890295 RepID=A0ABW9SS45_9BURK|nr:muramoyltetrapeptide carboxypeptidase [Pseudoduganella danionis]MTW34650.1 muramoyltetrapeptide carboxypeptidase [Pseudoduganella danionis]